MKKIRTCVVGSEGKMGKAILAELKKDAEFDAPRGIYVSRHPEFRSDSLGIFAPRGNGLHLVFDFTAPAVTLKSARYCAKNQVPLVTGTTGFTSREMAALRRYAQKTPILWSANMCLAVFLIEAILPLFGKILPAADIQIVEQHHRDKKDAPSGTALMFGQALQAVAANTIVYHSIRAGEAEGGENEVRFLAGQEEITIRHRSLSNQVYAQGALLAAKWLVTQTPGFYTMQNLLPKF